MPLSQIAFGYLTNPPPGTPHAVSVLWFTSSFAMLITSAIVVWTRFRQGIFHNTDVETESSRIIPSAQRILEREQILLPFFVCLFAYSTFWQPYSYYALSLVKTFVICKAARDLSYYFVYELGNPFKIEQQLRELTPQRWWCGLWCGGYADPLCCYAWLREQDSDQLHNLTKFDMQVLHAMVRHGTFIFFYADFVTFLATAWQVYRVTHSGIPVSLESDGFCKNWKVHEWWPTNYMTTITITIKVGGILACLTGLTMLAGVTSVSKGDDHDDFFNEKGSFKALLRMRPVQLFLRVGQVQFGLHLLFQIFPMGYHSPTILVKVTNDTTEHNGLWSASGYLVECPSFDPDVMQALLISAVATTVSMYAAWGNLVLTRGTLDVATDESDDDGLSKSSLVDRTYSGLDGSC